MYLKNLLFNKIFEPNKLSNKQIIDLCLEFYEKFVINTPQRLKKYPNPPKINIIEDLIWCPDTSTGYKQIFINYMNKIDKELPIDIQDFSYPYLESHPLNKSYQFLINKTNNLGGIINSNRYYRNIFKINDCGYKLSAKNQEFWNWYQKTFDVIAIYYNKNFNICNVIKKPDEWIFENNNTKMFYRYGNNYKYFFGPIAVPKWLYTTPAEELNPKDYLLLKNADVKGEFIKKIGIDKLIELGEIIDSYENYPDNEMWIKSEYKIIDMHQVIPQPKIFDNLGHYLGKAKPYKYAPFLYMKNQTTGVYHLEGIHPRCKTLYDAIKMRYNGLDIKKYDIKDIK
jgi:hypothetical protein